MGAYFQSNIGNYTVSKNEKCAPKLLFVTENFLFKEHFFKIFISISIKLIRLEEVTKLGI